MLELGHPCVIVIVGIVHRRHRLMEWGIKCLETERQGTIGKFAKTALEKLVNWSGVDKCSIGDLPFHFMVVDVKPDGNIWMSQQLLKQTRIAIFRHGLEVVGE